MSAVINPQDFASKLKSRILDHLADMIPEDKMEELVAAAIKEFFEEEQTVQLYNSTSYSGNSQASASVSVTPFKVLVYKHLVDLSHKALSTHYADVARLTSEQAQHALEKLTESKESFDSLLAYHQARIAHVVDRAYADQADRHIQANLTSMRNELHSILPKLTM